MIILTLNEGLGNQMFMYAFARNLQHTYNEKIYLNLYDYTKSKNRQYSLNNFTLNDNVRIMPNALGFICNIYNKLARLYRYIWKLDLLSEEFYNKLAKKGFYSGFNIYANHENILTKKNMKFVTGLFQSYKYFENISDIIRHDFTVKTAPSDHNRIMLDEIKSCNSVCMHIRRGDYVTEERWRKILEVCTYDYYKKGIDIIKSKVDNPVFYIFSNSHEDIEWIKKKYKFNANIKYVDLNNCDYEELRLMYSCKHFIISNSTFSWWAQYLSDNKKKVVIAPDKWIKDDKFNSDGIYMNEWNIIKV